MGKRAQTVRGLASLVLSIGLLGVIGTASAQAAVRTDSHPATKLVRYHGYVVLVPRSWPVYDLSREQRVCVRFDRHAVYLGTPGAAQRCPAHAAGRTEAILVSPVARRAGRSAARSASPAAIPAAGGRSATFVVPSARVVVTATWARAPSVVARAVGRRSLSAQPAAQPAAERTTSTIRSASTVAHAASAVYTGRGFDTCSTPSSRTMSAWGSSPYRAIGAYIGGANAACAQPNLTSSWVSNEIAAGWHLIPTYVGLQAPSNSCGCASISPGQASAEGVAAANDAATDAQAVGLPPGNPIYDDMEAYSRGGSNTSAVLAFLSAWTSQLHALGYLSGVYSNSDAGIVDMANAGGTAFVEPDDIWFAEWNSQANTATGYIPASDWGNHQRIHQYSGGHNETYGGVTINIDNDYVDAATADNATSISGSFTAQPPLPSTPPSLRVSPAPNGVTNFSASWSGAIGVTKWRVLGGQSGGAMAGIGSARVSGAVTHIAIRSAAPYYAVQALGSANQVLGTSAVEASPPHLAIYGRNAFVPARNGGMGGLPVGCYTGARCLISTTITYGRRVIGRTGPEYVGAGGAKIVYFRLTATGNALLTHDRSRRLPVQVTVRDVSSGQAASGPLALIRFTVSRRAAVAQLTRSPTLKVVGLTDFVYANRTGGILAGCFGAPLCKVYTTLSVGGTVIAHTGAEMLGADELGYLIFTLTHQGQALLAHAPGNRLVARLSLASSPATGTAVMNTSATVALVAFR